MDDKERLNAERAAKTKEYRGKIDPKKLAKIDARHLGEADAGIRYQPFNGIHTELPRAEIEAEQVYTGALGTIIRDLLKAEGEIYAWGIYTDAQRAAIFPAGLNQTYATAIELYRRWDHLDLAYSEVKTRIALARAPRIVAPTDKERIEALERMVASLVAKPTGA